MDAASPAQQSRVLRNILGIHYEINPFPNKPWFLRVCSTGLLKTLSEKEELLVTSNFSFSHSVSYPYEELSFIFIKFKTVGCKLFKFGSLKYVVWERVNPFTNQSMFLCVCSTSLSKTLWEKKKLLFDKQFLLFPQCYVPF